MKNKNRFVKIRRTLLQLNYNAKNKPMEDKEMKRFSRNAFLLVTGFSFLSFSKLLDYLDGTRLPFFTWIGLTAIIAGSFSSIWSLKEKTESN